MSLLSEPEARGSKWSRRVWRLHRKAALLACPVAVVWLCLLAHKPFNNGNYFSENALLPGLVRSDFVDDGSARKYLNNLRDELRENYENGDTIPSPWLAAMMHQINLDVYIHNFTLHYPLGKGQKFRGENVYGILRAGRSASTEALVLSAPFRPASSPHRSTDAGIALILAFAKFARSRKYWAKDLIFLITEHEQLGAQAWLEAYHGVGMRESEDLRSGPFRKFNEADKKEDKILDSGNLKGRSGAIQAAINLELPALDVKYIDVKIEGLNGQLPNLDLVNLVHKMCIKSNVHHAYKNSYSWVGNQGPWKNWLSNLSTLFHMIATQLTGVPSGNHGLFHRYGIEAVTMEGIENEPSTKTKSLRRGRPAHALEGTLRSLNNLLERFHQSFFFYLRPATDRFVSIGQYMPPLGILTGALFIRAFAIWLTTQRVEEFKIDSQKKDDNDSQKKDDNDSSVENDNSSDNEKEYSIPDKNTNLLYIGVIYLVTHMIGYVMMCSPQIITEIGVEYLGLPNEVSIFYGMAAFAVFLIIMLPPILNSFRKGKVTRDEILLLTIIALLELATLVLSIGMHNFSLGFCLAAIYAPMALLIDVPGEVIKRKRAKLFFNKVVWILLHPFILSVIVIFCYTCFTYPDENFKMIINHSARGIQQAVMFSVVDSMIYGNWLFSVITTTLFPTWMLFWQILNTKS